MAAIRNTFRKSFKSLINKGLTLFDNEVLDARQLSRSIWEEFKNLHLEVAGRKTRNEASWDKQYEMVLSGSAFLVTARDRASGRMIGAGFFQYTRDEGQYAVAAYDRNLFDQPIGHALQQLAIERMRALGLKWYKIGERRFTHELPSATRKEIAISEFKHGFASHVFMRLEYKWPVHALGNW
jgi:FemAB family protein